MTFPFDDLGLFFTDFAQKVKIGPIEVDAIFFSPGDSVALFPRGGVEVVEEMPRIIGKTADLKDLEPGDVVEVGGKTYYVVENLPDGTGVSTVSLSLDGM